MGWVVRKQVSTAAGLAGLARRGIVVFGPGPRGVTITTPNGDVRRLQITGFDGPYVRLVERTWVDG